MNKYLVSSFIFVVFSFPAKLLATTPWWELDFTVGGKLITYTFPPQFIEEESSIKVRRRIPASRYSKFRYAEIFSSQEIVRIHEPEEQFILFSKVQRWVSPYLSEPGTVVKYYEGFAIKTRSGKFIFPQLAFKSCTAAVVATLVFEIKKGLSDEIFLGLYGGLGNDETMSNLIRSAGLNPNITELIKRQDFEEALFIKQDLQRHGPAGVSFDFREGAHAMVVDSVNDDGTVTVRDPYHGWIIDITIEAFKKSCPHLFHKNWAPLTLIRATK